MIYRFSILILGALLSLFSFSLNAQGFGVVIDSFEVQTGQSICIPVKASGFVDIVSFQYTLTWNHQVLTLHHTQNYNLAGLSSSDFGVSPPNHLVISWANPTGQCLSKADGEVLYEVCFTAIGSPGSSTSIRVGSEGLPLGAGLAEAYTCWGNNVWSQMDTGYVEILPQSGTSDVLQNGEIRFQLAPNPTPSSAQVIFHSSSTGSTILLVTNALGRVVFEQKVSVKTGENRFEIPANNLNTKGIYQVSLQTKDGISSQILSVQ
ncbi:MAG: T9SS type A sorting domain-containing protein [Saprospiraceae bacterium]|nr:T9SS type A sorting domain-containing protein [Saprospiraceae bacterium]